MHDDIYHAEEPVLIPIEDTIDLHTFLPKEVTSLLEEYLPECVKAGIYDVRIIHGKGTGVLRKKVWSFLGKCPLVDSFQLADNTGGSWGATLVHLKKPCGWRP